MITGQAKSQANLDLFNIVDNRSVSQSSPAPHSSALPPTLELSVSQRFEIERFSRAIDATADPEDLKRIAKQLLQAWHTQKAATNWVIGQQLGVIPPA